MALITSNCFLGKFKAQGIDCRFEGESVRASYVKNVFVRLTKTWVGGLVCALLVHLLFLLALTQLYSHKTKPIKQSFITETELPYYFFPSLNARPPEAVRSEARFKPSVTNTSSEINDKTPLRQNTLSQANKAANKTNAHNEFKISSPNPNSSEGVVRSEMSMLTIRTLPHTESKARTKPTYTGNPNQSEGQMVKRDWNKNLGQIAKTEEEKHLEKLQQAAVASCGTAHSNKGLFAIPLLLVDSVREGGCRWR